MSLLDIFRPHVMCVTCDKRVLKAESVELWSTWAGEYYECAACDVVRKLEGRPSWYKEKLEPVLNRPRHMVM